jgi:hypothetical protein
LHRSVSRNEDYDAAAVEEVQVGYIKVETSLAHKFEGFYLQTEPLKIYEKAFMEKARRSKTRNAEGQLEKIRKSYASLGIHVDSVTHTVTIEKFFTAEKDPTKRATHHIIAAAGPNAGTNQANHHDDHGDSGGHRLNIGGRRGRTD